MAEKFSDRGVKAVADNVFTPLVTFWRAMLSPERRARVMKFTALMLPVALQTSRLKTLLPAAL